MGLVLPHAPQFSRYESNIQATPGVSLGTQVPNPDGDAHTKSTSPTQLIASTTFDAVLVVVTISTSQAANTNTSTLTDIMIGASTEEAVIIPDLLSGFAGGAGVIGGTRHFIFPLRVPSGSRISARSQSVSGSSTSTYVLVQLYGGPRDPAAWWSGSQVICYGADAANSCGTAFTPGNSGSEGSAVSVGTTSAGHECLVLGVGGLYTDAAYTALTYHFDVGIGASSTEWLTTDRFIAQTNANEGIGCAGTTWWPIFHPVPSGTEVMVRGECSGTSNAFSACVYGVS